MDALHLLHKRSSVAKLSAPAPTPEQCRQLIQAAVRAADHGNLQPWRFLILEGQGLADLGQVFVRAAQKAKPDLSDFEKERFLAMPLRAPLIMVVIAKCREHPKVPKSEQLISAGAAAQNILNAAYALGLGAFWRTGDMAYNPSVSATLGLAEDESLIGFIYLGAPTGELPQAKVIEVENFFQYWRGL